MSKLAMIKFLLALACAACAAGLAQAQTLQQPRYYAGLGANWADHDYQIPGVANVDKDGWATSVRAFVGADVDPIWGVEAGYDDFSSSDFNYNFAGVPGRGSSDGYGLYLAGKGRWPIYPQTEAFGKLGVAYSHRKLDSNPFVGEGVQRDFGLYAGVGLQWNFNPQWSVVGEYERFGRSKNIGASADVLSLSARINF